jgi:hypothetical protein
MVPGTGGNEFIAEASVLADANADADGSEVGLAVQALSPSNAATTSIELRIVCFLWT